MTIPSGLLGPHLQAFFVGYLGKQKRASPHTIASCRDTFRLLLTFVHDTTGRPPVTLRVSDLTLAVVLQFLEQLEQQRGNTVRSRNIRLSAIRSWWHSHRVREFSSASACESFLLKRRSSRPRRARRQS
jgi:site-specific recombinase XerC